MLATPHYDIEEVQNDVWQELSRVERSREDAAREKPETMNDESRASAMTKNTAPRLKKPRPVESTAGGSGKGEHDNETKPSDEKGMRKRRLPSALAPPGPNDTGHHTPSATAKNNLVGVPTLPLLTFPGETVVAETSEMIDAAVARVKRLCNVPGHPRHVGWDIEWVVTFKSGPPRKTALLQLCVRPRPPARSLCALLRLCRVEGGITPALSAFLQDSTVKKVGVQARGDAHKIMRDFKVPVAGVVELREFAASRVPAAPTADWGQPKAFSLAALVEWALQQRLPKKATERMSDWEAPKLSPEQCAYASLDAWGTLRLYEALLEMQPRAELQPTEPPALKRLCISGAIEEARTIAWEEKSTDGVGNASDVDVTPALAAEKQLVLRPAQKEAHRMHLHCRWSSERIAVSKGIKESTANNYLSDAMFAGRAYRFGLLGVPPEALAAVRRALGEYRKAVAAATTNATTVKTVDEGELGEGSKVPETTEPDIFALTASAATHPAPQSPSPPPSGAALTATTCRRTVRAVRELLTNSALSEIGGEVPYSHVTFAIAHIERLELLAKGEIAPA